MASSARAGERRLVDRVRQERRDPRVVLVLLAHRHPGVGGQDVGAVGGRLRVGGPRRPSRRSRRRSRAARSRTPGSGSKLLGRADPHVHAGRRARRAGRSAPCCWRRRRGRSASARRAVRLPLAHRLQVGEDLARVELVGQRVDHRHPADRGHGLDAGPGRRCARRSRRPAGRARGWCPRSARRGRAGCCRRR